MSIESEAAQAASGESGGTGVLLVPVTKQGQAHFGTGTHAEEWLRVEEYGYIFGRGFDSEVIIKIDFGNGAYSEPITLWIEPSPIRVSDLQMGINAGFIEQGHEVVKVYCVPLIPSGTPQFYACLKSKEYNSWPIS